MSSWFSGGGGGGGNRSWQSSLDSLKNQVSSSLREVVDAVAVDPSTLNPDDSEVINASSHQEAHRVHASPDIIQETSGDIHDQLELAIGEVARLKSIIDSQTQHIQKITTANQRLSIEKENAEKQTEVQGSQFRELLKDKEEEINQLLESPQLSSISEHGAKGTPKENIGARERINELEETIKELEIRLKEEAASHVDQMSLLHANDSDKLETLNGEIDNLRKDNLKLVQELQNVKKSSSVHSDISFASNDNTQESPDNSIIESDEILRLKEEKSYHTQRICVLENETETNESILAQKNEKILHLEKQLIEQEAEFLNYKNICDDLHIKIKDSNTERSDILEKLKSVTKECDTAKSHLAEQCTVFEEVQREKDSYVKNCDKLKISLEESERAHQETTERLKQALVETSNLKADNSAKEREISEASETYEELVRTNGKEREEFSIEIQKQKVVIENQLQEIERLRDESQSKILGYEDKLSNINFELEGLKKKNLQSSEEEKPSTADQVGMQKLIDELEKTKLDLQSSKNTIDNLNVQLQTEKDGKMQELENVRQTLVEENTVLQEECLELREQIKVQVNELEKAQMENNTILQEQNALAKANATNQDTEMRHKEDVRRLQERHTEEIEKLELRINNLNQTSVNVAAKLERNHKESIEMIENEQKLIVENLKEEIENVKTEENDRLKQLENQHKQEIARLKTVIDLSKNEYSELKQIEANQKCEIEKMDHVIRSLKEANHLMKEHANDSVSISEQYQQNLIELQGNLKVTFSFKH